MTTSLDIPDPLLQQAESLAAARGISLQVLIVEALAEKLVSPAVPGKPWMQTFGQLRDLRAETNRINREIENEFSQVNPEEWR